MVLLAVSANFIMSITSTTIFTWIQGLGFEDYLEITAGFFSLILFFLSIYAWRRRRRQSSLILVAVAFLLFFFEELVDIAPLSDTLTNLLTALLNFAILTLFFVAVVVKPRRKIAIENY